MTDKNKYGTELYKLQAPMVHLNGTARQVLAGDLEQAMKALREAEDFLQVTSPHGRDYYPLGPDALKTATEQHLDRLARLESVRAELSELYCKVVGL